jgi:uncharacterized protein involved in exopolysaccharide biosynthesis
LRGKRSPQNERNTLVHSFIDWIEAARYRWKLIALTAGLAVVAALIYLALTPRTYSAQASLIVDMEQPDPVEGENSRSSNNGAVMTTQADLIRTPRVAAEAAVAAGLDKDPAYIAEWRQETGGNTPYAEWLKRKLLSSLEVVPGKDTNILIISATADDPEEAARLANGFAKAAVSSRYRLRTEPAKAYAAWLENQMVGARANVLERQKALSDFVRQTGLSQGEDLGAQGSQVASISGQLASAEAAAAAARQSAYAEARSRGDAESSSTVQSLRSQVAQKSARLAELEAVFGPDYPDVQRTRAELGTLRSSLNSELANAQNTFASSRNAEADAARQAAVATENRLRSLAAREQARLQSLGVNVAQYTTLRNEFMAAQNNYNNLNQRLSTMRLQGAVPQTEVQVLDQASRFLASSLPNRAMTLSLAILAGLVLGTILAIILEFLNPRVRSWGGVERLLGVQVIGRVALPRQGPVALAGPTGPRLLPQGAA